MNYSKYVDVGNPVFQVNYQAGQICPPFEPVSDDQSLVNSVTAERIAGSVASYEKTDGPLSESEPPTGVGRYNESVKLNVASDEQLPGQAGWRVHLGTVNAYRYPSTTVKLHGSPELLDEYVDLALGDKLEVLNPPAWLPPGDIQMIAEGVQENFGWFHWDVSFNSSPGEPWTVAQLPLAEDSTVTEDFEDTTFAVTITDGGDLPWTRTSAQFHTGAWSLRSGAIGNNQTSDAVVTIPDGSRTMTFWYRTSSENFGVGFLGDRLIVLVDGVQVLLAQDETPWTEFTMNVEGASEVTFRYAKDNSAAAGEDAVYIADLSFDIPISFDAGTNQPNRAATSGSELYTAVDTDDTTLTVLTPQDGIYDRAPWIISEGLSDSPNLLPTHFPLDVALNGEIMEVSGISPFTYDSFARVEAAGSWGTADSGKAWTLDGGTTTERSVDGTYGLVNLSSSPNTIRFQLQPGSVGDCEIRAILSADQVATGESMIPGILLRYQ